MNSKDVINRNVKIGLYKTYMENNKGILQVST